MDEEEERRLATSAGVYSGKDDIREPVNGASGLGVDEFSKVSLVCIAALIVIIY